MHKYTFIMEFRVGKYISQATAPDVKTALIAWARNLNISTIQHLGEKGLLEL